METPLFFRALNIQFGIVTYMNPATFDDERELFPQHYIKANDLIKIYGEYRNERPDTFRVHRIFSSGRVDARRIGDNARVYLKSLYIKSIVLD